MALPGPVVGAAPIGARLGTPKGELYAPACVCEGGRMAGDGAHAVAVVLFTRDLRLTDQPALSEAARSSECLVPLFVRDDAIERAGFAAPNRRAFLDECLLDLDRGLREKGGALLVRSGDVVEETMRVVRESGASAIHLSSDDSAYAAARLARLRRAAGRACEVVAHPGVTVVASGDVEPAGGDHYKVFTPFWRAWSATPWRDPERAPARIELPAGLDVPPVERVPPGGPVAPERARGGFREAERRLAAFLDGRLADYPDASDMLARDGTSRLSPHLHFGTLSPLRAAELAGSRGDEAFVRQLCWRDFHHQVLRAFPALPRRDYRERDRDWVEDEEVLAAWREGRTGIPVVDAGMRQLLREGWMHNRARLLVASYLTKESGIHWSRGADVFLEHLVDGDLANNSGNWQWVAGTGNDTRPNRRFNLVRQARRFDPDGDYVRRFVPELEDLGPPQIHEPWRLGARELGRRGYPARRRAGGDPDGALTLPGV